MSILFVRKVIGQFISDTNTCYSPAELNGELATAERFFVQLRATQITGSPVTATVSIETSNTGQSGIVAGTSPSDWTLKNGVAILNAVTVSSSVQNVFGTDNAASPGGAFNRIGVKMGGTFTSASIEIWVTGRTLD